MAHRDEFTARPSAALDWWPDEPDILGGRDLTMQGSWLAVHRKGRLAAVTNVRKGPIQPAPKSRGEWIARHLLSVHSSISSAEQCDGQSAYGPFNALFADWSAPHGLSLAYGSNVYPASTIAPGIHALSNGALNAPWPKAIMAKQRLAALLESQEPPSDAWLNTLRDKRKASDAQLPDTGVGLEKERLLSSMLITGTGYGTRAATFLSWRKCGAINVTEQTLSPENDGEILFERQFQFSL